MFFICTYSKNHTNWSTKKLFILRYGMRSRIFLYFYSHNCHKSIIIILFSIYTLTHSRNYISLGTYSKKHVYFTHDFRFSYNCFLNWHCQIKKGLPICITSLVEFLFLYLFVALIIKYATLVIFNIITTNKIICYLTQTNNLVVEALKKNMNIRFVL